MSNSTIESDKIAAALRKLIANAKSALVDAEALLDFALATQACPSSSASACPSDVDTTFPAFPLNSNVAYKLDYLHPCHSLIELEELFRRGDTFFCGEGGKHFCSADAVSIKSFAKGQRVSLQSTNRHKLFVTV